MSDDELLRQFAQDHAQEAFTELVRRHVDLVYSAARRQVHSATLAEEVTQSVFLDLSRHAGKIKTGTPLVAWLHVVTRRTAIDVIREETRRQRREQLASEIATMPSTPSIWTELEPFLDEALTELNETDRSALLLRYFENRNLRDVGLALGLSDDTAQKRVTRALERLRKILSKRAIAVSAAGLATEISLHAVQPAPAGFAAALKANMAVPALVTTKATAFSSAKSLAMTASQKFLIASAVLVVAAIGIYQTTELQRRERELDRLSQIFASREQEILQLTKQHNEARTRLERALAARAAASTSGDLALDERLRLLLANVAKLKERLDQSPGQKIPELRFLPDMAWFDVALKHPELKTDDDYNAALAALRIAAKETFLPLMSNALKGYTKVSNGVLPPDVQQLASYFHPPVEPALLARYEMAASGPVSQLRTSTEYDLPLLIREKSSMVIAPYRDRMAEIQFWPKGNEFFCYVSEEPEPPASDISQALVALNTAAEKAAAAYIAANNGKPLKPSDIEKLAPFFERPEDAAKYLQVYKEQESRKLPYELGQALEEAQNAFRAAHHGTEPTDALELASYFRDPKDGARYYLIWQKNQNPSR